MRSAATATAACVLIPAHDPGQGLTAYVARLAEAGLSPILVVDDGSPATAAPVFDELRRHPDCIVVRHAVRLGRGGAIRTGLNRLLLEFPDAAGVVIANQGGEYDPADLRKVAGALRSDSGAVVAGYRAPSALPWHTRLLRGASRSVLHLFTGQRVADPHCALRGIPMSAIPELLRLDGEGDHYELNLFVRARDLKLKITEVPLDSRAAERTGSPFAESMQTSVVFARFAFTSLLTSCIDQIIFWIAWTVLGTIGPSIAIARIASSVVNLALNRDFVFKSNARLPGIVLRYYTGMLVSGCAAYILIRAIREVSPVPVIAAKLAAETLLFLFSFVMSKYLIFIRRDEPQRDAG